MTVSSVHYGSEQTTSIAETLESLEHGPEMAELSVYVATPGETADTCGATVIACYAPSLKRMVVSGVDRPVGGVSRDFAIAHEYGHHIANSQQSSLYPAIEAGTIRWATYERVCQLTRAHRLYPGNQDAHYWENPEEAFAQSYAQLNQPDAGVSWQYTSFLEPTSTSFAKIRADIAKPWSGPVTATWNGTVSSRPLLASRLVRTPLDGAVSVSLKASAGDRLSVVLRDSLDGRVLARDTTDGAGDTSLSFSNCGRSALRLEVRSVRGGVSFQATIERP